MAGEENLNKLLKKMEPFINKGEYVFVAVGYLGPVTNDEIIGLFKETEGTTIVLERKKADKLGLHYNFIASWITLKVHSSLTAIGLTATFSSALAEQNISCNVIAGYYHDHIFVDKKDAQMAFTILKQLSKNNR